MDDNLYKAEFGRNGGVIIKDTNAHPGRYNAIAFFEQSVINTIEMKGFTGTLNGETMPRNFVLIGEITNITLTSGKCICYNEVNE